MLTGWDSGLGSSSFAVLPLVPPLPFFLEEDDNRFLVSGHRPSEVKRNRQQNIKYEVNAHENSEQHHYKGNGGDVCQG